MTFFRTREHRIAVLGTIGVFAAMTVVRLAHVLTTGFMTNDEGLYMLSAILSAEKGRLILSYPNRLLYVVILAVSGVLLNLDNVYKTVTFLSIFNFAWTSACVLGFYKVAETFFSDSDNLHIFIVGLPALAMMAVANVAYLTEAMALALLLFGTYLTGRLLSPPHRLRYALGGLFIGVAFFIREPYGVVSLGMIAYMAIHALRRRIPLIPAIIFVSMLLLCFRLPVDNSSVNFTNFVFLEISEGAAGMIERVSKIQVDFGWLREAPRDIHSGGYAPPHLEQYEQKPLDIQTWSTWGQSMRIDSMLNPARLRYSFIYTVAGMFLGTNPLAFVLMPLGLAKILRGWRPATEQQRMLAIISILSVLTVAGSGFLTGLPTQEAIDQKMGLPWGTMTRLSHTGILTALLIVPALGSQRVISNKRLRTAILIGLVMFGVFGRIVVYSFERQFSSGYVDRVNFGYRAPYVRVYDYTEDTGKTLLFGGMNVVLVNMYTRMRPNVFVAYYPPTEAEFLEIIDADDWDTVLFHATTHYTVNPTIEELMPFSWEVIHGRTEYEREVVWDDGESFLHRVGGWQ